MTSAIPEALLDRLGDYVAESMGLHYPSERRADLERGLSCAARELGFKDALSCARWLLLSPLTRHQIEVLAGCLTVGETYFFRDPIVFDLLEGHLLPGIILKRRTGERRLRIWSAGCATGEEPYSIAILLRRLIPDIQDWSITLLATDINPHCLARAREGLYGKWSFRNVPAWVISRYFKKTDEGQYALSLDIRKHVTFAYHNLAGDTYPAIANNTNAMDIIFCRNVFMYFSQERRGLVAEKLSQCLIPGGLLVVSPAEMSAALGALFSSLPHPGAAIYRKDGAGTNPWQDPIRPSSLLPPFQVRPRTLPPMPEMGESAPAKPPPPHEAQGATASRQDLYQDALRSYERGLHGDAQVKLETLLAHDPGMAAALALLSRIRASGGSLADARDLCKSAIASDKLNAGYHYLLAMIQIELGREPEAIASLQHTLYLDPEFVLAHFGLGTIALGLGKLREARRHFENAQSALGRYGNEEILPESEGITAGRMAEMIDTTIQTATKASDRLR
jgi:chemotaxis protein methyltransferase CheR